MRVLDRVVIVGAGPAGLAVARAYRERGGGGEVTLLGAERQMPYPRPPLTTEFVHGELGTRQNRHQSLRDPSAMAYAVLVAAQTRLLGAHFTGTNACSSIVLPPGAGMDTIEHRPVAIEERPPLAASSRWHA